MQQPNIELKISVPDFIFSNDVSLPFSKTDEWSKKKVFYVLLLTVNSLHLDMKRLPVPTVQPGK